MQRIGLRSVASSIRASQSYARTFTCGRYCLQTSSRKIVFSFSTAGHIARAGPVQKTAAATVGPLPQDGSFIVGTVNDPTPFPAPSKTHGSYHWTFERLVSAALVPIVGATFVSSPNPVLDGVLAVSLVLHSHMGFDSCIVDYVHTRKFPKAGLAAKWGLRVLTVGTLIGVYEFNTNDVGLTELVIRLWKA